MSKTSPTLSLLFVACHWSLAFGNTTIIVQFSHKLIQRFEWMCAKFLKSITLWDCDNCHLFGRSLITQTYLRWGGIPNLFLRLLLLFPTSTLSTVTARALNPAFSALLTNRLHRSLSLKTKGICLWLYSRSCQAFRVQFLIETPISACLKDLAPD